MASSAPTGLRLFPGFLDRDQQEQLVAALRDVIRRAPLFTPTMPSSGKPFSVRMTNCGGSLPRQLLRSNRPHGTASGPQRGRPHRAGRFGLAGRDMPVSYWGNSRSAATRSFPVASGDVLILGGAARLAFHGVDRIVPGTSTLLPDDSRINLTLRRVRAITQAISTIR